MFIPSPYSENVLYQKRCHPLWDGRSPFAWSGDSTSKNAHQHPRRYTTLQQTINPRDATASRRYSSTLFYTLVTSPEVRCAAGPPTGDENSDVRPTPAEVPRQIQIRITRRRPASRIIYPTFNKLQLQRQRDNSVMFANLYISHPANHQRARPPNFPGD